MATTGQTINDRLNAVRYALAGQGLARTVCKATTEEVLGPKKKHMDYLLACTEEPNVSIPQLANLLIDRTQHTSWAVVFKSLITIHHLLNYGNERFTQYLATSNHSFELNDFMDRTTPQGYNMSTFVRRYAKYINDKISSYKTLAIDLCKIKPGKDNALRTMNMENLTKTLPVVHTQFDSLLEFNIEAKDVNNGIIMAAFKLLYKDLNRIFAAYQEAIINLVERFFNLSRKKAREALNMYKKYLARLDKVASFFKVVEQVGLDKSEMPDTSKLTSLLGVFEAHLAQLEAKKRGTTPSSPPGDGAETSEPPKSPPTSKESSPPEQQAKAAAQQEAEQTAAQSAADEQSTGDTKQAEAPPKSSQSPPEAAASKPAKKTPPARPSPIVSPSEPKPTAGGSAATATPAAPAAASEKKAPERPTKPPSRPPPPTAAAPAAPAAAAAAAAAPSGAQASSKAPSPPPPPPPPPPHPTQQAGRAQSPAMPEPPRASTTTTNEPAAPPTAVAATLPAPHEGNGSSETSHVDGPRASCAETGSTSRQDGAADLPACSASELAGGEGAPQVDEAETNHISNNNVESNHVGALPNNLDPPPPPPPIEDVEEPEEAVEAIEGDNGVAGEHASDASEPRQEQENDAVTNEELPPPPPPPIED